MRLREDKDWFTKTLGTGLRMTDLDVVNNEMVIYVSNRTPVISDAIAQRYGVGDVRVERFEEGGGLDACTRTNCGPPWVGGVKIYRDAVNGCTLGFIVRKGSTGPFGVWTAGHCGTATWHQGSINGATIGTTLAGSNRFVDGSTADVQVIPITQKTNKYIADTATCNPCNTPALTGTQVQQPFNGDEVGDSVCNNGAFTGRSCGVIQSVNVDNFAYLGVDLWNQRRATYQRMGGDSGGPVVASIGLEAAGSHVHFQPVSGFNRPIYSHVFEMSLAVGGVGPYYVWNGTNP
jgi:hypothetical protein